MSDKIRFTGLSSGLDTESLITALTSSYKTKVDTAKMDQKKLGWTQDAWKDMNKSIYGLYSGKLSTMRFSQAYSKKVTTSSNSALTVEAGSNAAEGITSAKIISMAKAGYMTGGKISAEDGSALTNDSKVTDLGIEVGTKFSITAGGQTKEIEVTEDMTMSQLTSAMREIGVNANFDVDNKRLFISSKNTGEDNDFSIDASDEAGNAALAKLGLTAESGAVKIDGTDAELELNGARFTSSSNSMKINGSTYTINGMSDETISLKTSNDTSSIYDSIESLLKEYNDTMSAMSKSYYAESASKYKMLTDEMRDALSEKEAEDWDNKIKDSLLRKDSKLGNIMQVMRSAMMESIEIDGQEYSLADFGIGTGNYFSTNESDRYLLHIDGNSKDELTSGKADKLRDMISTDPELVTKFFSALSDKLYGAMGETMKSTDYSSIYKVYDDKKMKSDYDSYTRKIADLEAKLSDAEDRYYKKFSVMEKAMAKLNESNTGLSSLFNM